MKVLEMCSFQRHAIIFRVSRKGSLKLVFYGKHSVDSYPYTCQLMGMEEKGRVRGRERGERPLHCVDGYKLVVMPTNLYDYPINAHQPL